MLRAATLLLACTVLAAAISTPPAAAYTIRKCDPIAEADIGLAADYLNRRHKVLANQFTHLTRANRREFVDKWPKLKIVCQDEGRRGKSRQCLAAAETGGMAHGGIGNRINLCYYNIVEFTDPDDGSPSSICDLVGFIVHEAGHAHGFPTFANHNNPDTNVFDNDPVYVMQTIAENFCRKDITFVSGIEDSVLLGRSNLALDDECRADDQCLSGLCRGGICQCDQDRDCPSGQRCVRPAVGANKCRRTDLGLNAQCTRNDECRSDKCEGGRCVCRTDGDCPTGQVCRTPITRQNFCEAGDDGNRLLGANCTRNNQCKSGRCQGNHCVCRSDSDCPAGESCFTPATRPNYCRSTALPLNANCNRNSQCLSDRCQGGQCRCRRDSDCPGSKKCKKPVVGHNRCE